MNARSDIIALYEYCLGPTIVFGTRDGSHNLVAVASSVPRFVPWLEGLKALLADIRSQTNLLRRLVDKVMSKGSCMSTKLIFGTGHPDRAEAHG